MQGNLALLALAALLAFVSCGRTPDTAAREGSAAPSAPIGNTSDDAGRVVRLTPEALAMARLVLQEASSRSIPHTIRGSGRIAINENRLWRVGAVSDGLLVEMYANVDDPVRRGQVLARQHSRAVSDARAAYAEAANNLATFETRRSFLQAQAARARRLYDLKAASEQQVQQAESDVRDVEGQIANAKAELQRQRIHIEEFLHVQPESSKAPGDLASGYKSTDLIPVTSPVSGMVMERPAAPGTIVPMAQTLYVISDLSNLWMIAEVQQQHLAALREGMEVAVHTQAFPEEIFPGRIARIGAELNPATRTVSVRIEVPNPQMRLRPEMYADAEIATSGSETGVFLPTDAIQDLNGQAVAFVRVAEGAFAVRPVETGAPRDGMRLILSGVNAGEQVVVRGSFLLKSKLLEASLAE